MGAPSGAEQDPVILGDRPLTVEEVSAVAREGAAVEISASAQQRIQHARTVVEDHAGSERAIYGVSTGFGALAHTLIDAESRDALQLALVRSHAAGTGTEVEAEVVRAMMLLRLQTFTTGRTGVRLSTAQRYAALLNHGFTPVVYEYGSLGCSGDLAPLAHCALAVIGEGQVRSAEGRLLGADEAFTQLQMEPRYALAAKEGLALINGTDGMLGMLALSLVDLAGLVRTAEVATAMSIEALLGTDRVFAEEVQAVRAHHGQSISAANLRALLADSEIVASHRGEDCSIVQDAYSLRCAPQVAGAVRDTLAHAQRVAEVELAAAVDNPVVLDDGRIESNGNFHGAPVGYVLDFLAIATADLASIGERRTDRMLDPARSHGLPAFLGDDPGLDSGFMIAQYTQASMVSELKRLAAPASVDSIPSSAMQEDHVSMGWAAGRKLRRGVDALTRVVAIEVLIAARALDLRRPLCSAPATSAVIGAVRDVIPAVGEDRYLSPEIEAAVALVRSGTVVSAAESAAGKLG
ncbi:histidine ammonia-lyase [Nesterenkonia aerolata]|uniref:Histidine ammonia-lyase n=1 Tax=Nesterenkonia aerolata TaxID=3074079 RepID=A0ABU2DSS8_9MICC|nr:histidine ammonia-lyase [Nesterenkonia sp. LY-0111]MDR8019436.1 histidine ammonia-lyase [Nesterenkonia sp. LY-0111]